MNKMNKPTICRVCGYSWLADLGTEKRLTCLCCGAEHIGFAMQWKVATKQDFDLWRGSVALTRNAHMMTKEGLDRILDDLGL
tara:strand:+ start:89 stop:334 length:246 start_codon:yes stop_codon:yes gene_type:complete